MTETLASLLQRESVRDEISLSARILVSAVVADTTLTGLPAIKAGDVRDKSLYPADILLEVLAEGELSATTPMIGMRKIYRLSFDGTPVLFAGAVINERNGHVAIYDAQVTNRVGIARLSLAVLEALAVSRISAKPPLDLDVGVGKLLSFGKGVVVDLDAGTIESATKVLSISSKPTDAEPMLAVLRTHDGRFFTQLDNQEATPIFDVRTLEEVVSSRIRELFDESSDIDGVVVDSVLLDDRMEVRSGLSGVAIRKGDQMWMGHGILHGLTPQLAEQMIIEKAREMVYSIAAETPGHEVHGVPTP